MIRINRLHTSASSSSSLNSSPTRFFCPASYAHSSLQIAEVSDPSRSMDALWMGACEWSSAAASATSIEDEEAAAAAELRKGPWTVEEDAVLAHHVAANGEGRWNELARAAGLRRTGKSCRLRWLNYLRPGVRRGDFAPREQLLILELHFRWGNRWSRIAAHLPGRTDNEVKNYWRTRVQKHARQLGCDVGSRRFRDVMRQHWMPRLVERIHADSGAAVSQSQPATTASKQPSYHYIASNNCGSHAKPCASPDASCVTAGPSSPESSHEAQFQTNSPIMDAAGAGYSSSTEQCQYGSGSGDMLDGSWSELLARTSPGNADSTGLHDFEFGEIVDNFWSLDDMRLQQLH